MNNLNKYIRVSICEITVKLFNDSKFTTYNGYCKSMKNALYLQEFTKKELYELQTTATDLLN